MGLFGPQYSRDQMGQQVQKGNGNTSQPAVPRGTTVVDAIIEKKKANTQRGSFQQG